MKILLDAPGIRRFTQIAAARYQDDRAYYVARDRLTIVVCRNRTRLSFEVARQVADAQAGWDEGTRGFVLEAHEGKRHSKLTIYRIVAGRKFDMTLSQFLHRAPEPLDLTDPPQGGSGVPPIK